MSILAQRNVLVLNKSWVAYDIWTLRKAIIELFKVNKDGTPKARIVKYADEVETYTWDDWSKLIPKDDESFLSSPENKFKIPEIVLVSTYNGFPKQRNTFSRHRIYKLYDNQCQYCGKYFNTSDLNVDHIVAQSKGGKTCWENCVLACIPCNSKKANHSLEEVGMKLICGKPKKPSPSAFPIPKIKCDSWAAFISEVYWQTPLDE